MACAVVKDQERRNLECADDFFHLKLDPPTAAMIRRDRHGNLLGPNLGPTGNNWYKPILPRHPALSAMDNEPLNNAAH